MRYESTVELGKGGGADEKKRVDFILFLTKITRV